MEFDYPEIYAPLDLGIGNCRRGGRRAAWRRRARDDPARWSHVRVATKYPNITRRHFAARGVQAECVKLNGAMELAPSLGLSPADRRPGADRLDAEGQRLVETEVIAAGHLAG